MKKVLSILGFLLLSVSIFSQNITRPIMEHSIYLESISSTLINNLNFDLKKSQKSTKIGIGLFIGGATTTIIGGLILSENNTETGNNSLMKLGYGLVIGGGLITTVSIPVMVIGNKKSTEILFQIIQQQETEIKNLNIGIRKRF